MAFTQTFKQDGNIDYIGQGGSGAFEHSVTPPSYSASSSSSAQEVENEFTPSYIGPTISGDTVDMVDPNSGQITDVGPSSAEMDNGSYDYGSQYGTGYTSSTDVGTFMNNLIKEHASNRNEIGVDDANYWNMYLSNALEEYFINKQYDYAQSSADKANQFSHDEAVLSREWQEYYDKNSASWQMESLKKAGINPMLAFMNGSFNGGSASSVSATGSSASGSSGSSSGTEKSGALKILQILASLFKLFS